MFLFGFCVSVFVYLFVSFKQSINIKNNLTMYTHIHTLEDCRNYETDEFEFNTFDKAVASAEKDLMGNLSYVRNNEGYSNVKVTRVCNPELESYSAVLEFTDPEGDHVTYTDIVICLS